jgi:DNA-directed RNA polymerase subunit RPC12/RpoP
MSADTYILREFTCIHCGHTIIVNPKLPKNYTPSVCTPCFDRIVVPKMEENERQLMASMQKFLALLGLDLK